MANFRSSALVATCMIVNVFMPSTLALTGLSERAHDGALGRALEAAAQASRARTDYLTGHKQGFTPVKVEVFYEMMCPACQFFFGHDLLKVWSDPQMRPFIDMKLFPFGNGAIKGTGPDYKFECQHGENECQGNMLQACAVKKLGTPDLYMPFVFCMEKNAGSGPKLALSVCAKELAVDEPMIDSCSTTAEASRNMFEIATHSDEVQPPRAYTPWVLVNDKHAAPTGGTGFGPAEGGNLVGVICSAIKAQGSDMSSLPAACATAVEVAMLWSESETDSTGADHAHRPPPCWRAGSVHDA